ncbi:MAG: hypothetical protein HC779_08565 [Phyllobacteriaceae bacterium]|nr:hypothetical protein [Phyllobacteriaceae bacterium]
MTTTVIGKRLPRKISPTERLRTAAVTCCSAGTQPPKVHQLFGASTSASTGSKRRWMTNEKAIAAAHALTTQS